MVILYSLTHYESHRANDFLVGSVRLGLDYYFFRGKKFS